MDLHTHTNNERIKLSYSFHLFTQHSCLACIQPNFFIHFTWFTRSITASFSAVQALSAHTKIIKKNYEITRTHTLRIKYMYTTGGHLHYPHLAHRPLLLLLLQRTSQFNLKSLNPECKTKVFKKKKIIIIKLCVPKQSFRKWLRILGIDPQI